MTDITNWLNNTVDTIRELREASPTLRSISNEEIELLRNNGNSSTDWSLIRVRSDQQVSVDCIHHCRFEGDVLLGSYDKDVCVDTGHEVKMPCGLYGTSFIGTCIIENNCLIKDTHVISNTVVGCGSAVVGCDFVMSTTPSTFGNSVVVSLGPECGGRNVRIHALQKYTDLCIQLFDRSACTERGAAALPDECVEYTGKLLSTGMTLIAPHCLLFKCAKVVNCFFGIGAVVRHSDLQECFCLSSLSTPVVVDNRANLTSVIMMGNTRAEGCQISSSMLYEYSSVSGSALVQECVLGPDAHVSGGECCHSLLGPHVGFHHSSLLIATLWPLGRGNLAYGCKVGANHTGRVADQECLSGEGCFYGLGVQLKFPFNSLGAPYSLFAAGVTCLPQRLSFPFSLVSAPVECSCRHNLSPAFNSVKPAWVLYANPYMMERANSKFTNRRESKLYCTDFPAFRPSTVSSMINARKTLQSLISSKQDLYTERDCPDIGKNFMTHEDAERAIRAYDDCVKRYILQKGLVMFISGKLPSHGGTRVEQEQPRLAASALLAEIQNLASTCRNPETGQLGPYKNLLSDIRLLDTSIKESNETRDPLLWCLRTLCMEYTELVADNSNTPLETLQKLLKHAVQLEEAHAQAVNSCKGGDGKRGRRVIPDYDAVHPSADNDTIVINVYKGLQDLRNIVDNILNLLV